VEGGEISLRRETGPYLKGLGVERQWNGVEISMGKKTSSGAMIEVLKVADKKKSQGRRAN